MAYQRKDKRCTSATVAAPGAEPLIPDMVNPHTPTQPRSMTHKTIRCGRFERDVELSKSQQVDCSPHAHPAPKQRPAPPLYGMEKFRADARKHLGMK